MALTLARFPCPLDDVEDVLPLKAEDADFPPTALEITDRIQLVLPPLLPLLPPLPPLLPLPLALPLLLRPRESRPVVFPSPAAVAVVVVVVVTVVELLALVVVVAVAVVVEVVSSASSAVLQDRFQCAGTPIWKWIVGEGGGGVLSLCMAVVV